jgi:hypothetical protein
MAAVLNAVRPVEGDPDVSWQRYDSTLAVLLTCVGIDLSSIGFPSDDMMDSHSSGALS